MTDKAVQDGSAGEQPQEKTAKQLEKEAKKAAKLEKLKAKLDKKSAAPAVQKDKPEVGVSGSIINGNAYYLLHFNYLFSNFTCNMQCFDL